ncbi:hypothetical protein BH18ACT17_BH18ACT17_08350 [soil metagenome]
MGEPTGTELRDEYMVTYVPGTTASTETGPRDADGTDCDATDGTDGDATDGNDGDGKDADGTDSDTTDGTDADGTDTATA